MTHTKTSWFSILTTFFGSLILLFIIAPMLGLLLESSSSQILQSLNDKKITNSIFLTLEIAGITSVVVAIIAIPFSYFLARKDFPFKNIISAIIELPMFLPHTAAGIALFAILSKESWFGNLALRMGLDFIENPLGIGIAMAFVSVGYLVSSARNAFEEIPERLEKAAMILGASTWKVFSRISLRLAWRNIVSGIVMMFSRGISEFGAVAIIAYYPNVGSTLIFERFMTSDFENAKHTAIVFLIISLVVFIVMKLLSNQFTNSKSYKLKNIKTKI